MVRDNGPGMDAAAQQRMFDPFYSTKVAGHGLGLSVVLGIVSSNEAAIAVNSQPGAGTVMTVLFPVSAMGDTDHAPIPREPIHSGEGRTILVVDDEKAVRELAANVLSSVGYRVVRAENGDAALDLLATHGSGIAAVLLDVTMPRRDGHSTLREIRKSHPELPVVFSSGAPLEPPAGDGFVRILTKPYTASTLARAVARALDGSFGGDNA
jgi:CheY-like chemotaxis protein